MIDKRTNEELGIAKEIEFSFHILNYNQGLIQFADSKANALLLINSIFIASLSPFIEGVKKGGNMLTTVLMLVFLAGTIGSILLCFAIISNRKVPELEKSAQGLIFYGHVLEHRSPDGYLHEFANYDLKRFRESILRNIFVVSKIASTKYTIYNFAQALTFLGCVFWILTLMSLMIA